MSPPLALSDVLCLLPFLTPLLLHFQMPRYWNLNTFRLCLCLYVRFSPADCMLLHKLFCLREVCSTPKVVLDTRKISLGVWHRTLVTKLAEPKAHIEVRGRAELKDDVLSRGNPLKGSNLILGAGENLPVVLGIFFFTHQP